MLLLSEYCSYSSCSYPRCNYTQKIGKKIGELKDVAIKRVLLLSEFDCNIKNKNICEVNGPCLPNEEGDECGKTVTQKMGFYSSCHQSRN